MIYLIKSFAGNVDDLSTAKFILKIGYTEDTKSDKRYLGYKLSNPSCKVIYEIPGLTMDDEQRIHYYFRELRYQEYGREWYEYSEEILDFFEHIQDYDIQSFPKSPMSEKRDHRRMWRFVRNSMYLIPEIPKEKKEDYARSIVDELGTKLQDWRDLVPLLLRDYGDQAATKFTKIQEAKESKTYSSDLEINREISQFFEEYDNISLFRDKLRFLCEYGLSDIALKIVLDQVGDHDNIKSYYLALGPTRLRALSYDKFRIRKELGIVIFDKDLLDETILSNFMIGYKGTNAEIKSKLQNLYLSISYTASPKAVDLEIYFIVRPCRITLPSKVRVHCLEIIDVKSEYKELYEKVQRRQNSIINDNNNYDILN